MRGLSSHWSDIQNRCWALSAGSAVDPCMLSDCSTSGNHCAGAVEVVNGLGHSTASVNLDAGILHCHLSATQS